MKRLIAFILALVCVLGLVGCNKDTDTMYQLGIVVDGVFYEKPHQPSPMEVDESVIIGYVESYTDTFPEKNGETNISKDMIGESFAKVEGGIAILFQNEWWLCTADAADTVSFHDKTFNKADLSTETLEWLEKYNAMSEDEQLAISYIPEDLYELCGYGEAENGEINAPTK